MKLEPRRPPGRATRKAAAFADDILRLRAEGYTCIAIKEALAEAGVTVSKSSVQREAARCSKSPPVIPAASTVTPPALDVLLARAPVAPPVASSLPPASPRRSGREIAESFVNNRINNPLFRNRSSHEDSRH